MQHFFITSRKKETFIDIPCNNNNLRIYGVAKKKLIGI